MNYYPHHIGDYLRDTTHLSLVEHGAYRRMLDIYYATERPLPKAQVRIYRLVGAKSHVEKLAVDVVLGEFWTECDAGWTNARADSEIAKAREKSEKARGSAAHRWECVRTADAMRTHSEGNAPNNQEPITNNQEPKKKSARARATPIPTDFSISERVTTWAGEKGYGQLDRYLEFFKGRMKANGKTYIDWDEAFMNCIREDWPELRKATAPSYEHLTREPS